MQKYPKGHFKKRAKKYNQSSKWVDDLELIDKIYKFADIKFDELVLDLGVGTGKIAKIFYGRCKCVVGLDICMEMVNQAKDCADGIVLGKGEKQPFKNGVFDVCVCRQGLQFMKLEDAFREIYRVLKPEGRVVLCHLTAYGNRDKDTTFLIQKLRNPARKNFFLPEDFVNRLKIKNFVDIESFEYITRESVNQWIDNGAIDKEQMKKIRNIYIEASDDFEMRHNVEFKNEDIFDSMKMFIVRAKKPGR